MYTLCSDSSVKQSSVSIFSDDKCIYSCVQDTGITHSQNLLVMIKSALETCNLEINDINLLVATKGPGSFTGIRINLALIKGMASANDTDCLSVSSLKALRASIDFDGVVIPCFDARRGQVYTLIEDEGNILLDECCIKAENLEKIIQNIKKPIIFIGDGANLCYNIFNKYKNVKPLMNTLIPTAFGAGLLAIKEYQENGAKKHFELTADYLRLSQAERELKEKQEDVL